MGVFFTFPLNKNQTPRFDRSQGTWGMLTLKPKN